MPFVKIIRATLAGADTGPFTIYHTSVAPGNIIASGVSRSVLLSGYYATIPDGATTIIVVSNGLCTNSVTLTVSPDPVPTPTPTPVPTATPTPSPTPAVPTLTLSYIKGPGLFTVNLNTIVGVDINIGSVYADGYTSPSGGTAVSSAAKTIPVLALPAGSSNFSFFPETRCGQLTAGSSATNACWATATHYTLYNVIINGTPVFNGQTLNIGGTNVLISFPPLRPLLA